ncbi:unnamed protein product [Onchocerca flexuosa]|uniref:Ovule protein n=1 Tax=Onchocerca flexuosa TaxID=387005 RepID=A0A183HLQ8_9BILA|nr:unnamed protein product [Onchocerca flexuosa]
MSSSSWEIEGNRFGEIQEDPFDDDDSDKLSNYEDSLYIDDLAIEEHQKLDEATTTNHLSPRHSTIAEESNIDAEVEQHRKLNEAAITNHLPPRLSTIAEESNIGAEGCDYFLRVTIFEDSLKNCVTNHNSFSC